MSGADRDRHGRIMAEESEGSVTMLVTSIVLAVATLPVTLVLLQRPEVRGNTTLTVVVVVGAALWLLNCLLGALQVWRRLRHDRETEALTQRRPPSPTWQQQPPPH